MGGGMPVLMVRYGELGLKSRSVRARFEQALVSDLRRKHVLREIPCVIESPRGRVFIHSDDWRGSLEILSRTFGIVSFSPATKVPSGLEELVPATVAFAEPALSDNASFAIRARRTGNHEYTSQELAGRLGAAVLEANRRKGITVDLTTPDVEISVEVRDTNAYLFDSSFAGPGGMPKGTQGRVLSLVASERGIASSWLMMKRGCTTVVATEDEGLVAPLKEWDAELKVVPPDGDLFDLAQRHRCSGVALEWRLDDLERSGAPEGPLPVFYPLIGMDDREVDARISTITR
jgi:thiamine biosynthesis protein ThiI